MKWGETAHCGGFDWKKSPPEIVLDVYLCLSGGKFELDPREGRGVGGGWRRYLPGFIRRQHVSECRQTPQTQILGCQLFGEMEGTEHFGNTSFPHLHLEQIGWKHSGLGPELDLSYGRRPFFFQVLSPATGGSKSMGSAPARSLCAGCGWPLGSRRATTLSPQCPRSPSPPRPEPR